jgi:hypothetical protein
MIRIKAKTPTPAPRAAPRARVKAAKAPVAAQVAALDALLQRAHVTAERAQALVEAISGECCETTPIVTVEAARVGGLVGTLGDIATGFAHALDRCDIAIDKALAGLG